MKRSGWAILIICVLVAGALLTTMVSDESKKTAADPMIFSTSLGDWQEEVVEQVGSGKTKIVLLDVTGVIIDNGDTTSAFSSSVLLTQMDQVLTDERVKGVVIRVDSPGGTVIDSELIYDKILELQQAGIKVGVSMGSVAASGGYYIAAPADFIYANPATITGSIGVVFSIPNYQKAADWLGYSETKITSGNMKDIGNPLRPMTNEERAVYQSLVDESYDRFVEIIVNGRNMPKEEVLTLADGRIYSGKQAKQLNLVDELGSLEDSYGAMGDLLNSENYRVVQYQLPFNFESLFGSFIQSKSDTATELIQQLLPGLKREPTLLYIYE
jgi:protease-4